MNPVVNDRHPVEQWRAVRELMNRGDFSMQHAAMSLGLGPVTVRRMDHLSRMAPEIIEALAAQPKLPSAQYLRVISHAAHDVQIKALVAQRGKGKRTNWRKVSEHCEAVIDGEFEEVEP
jgi:hypothetical protein